VEEYNLVATINCTHKYDRLIEEKEQVLDETIIHSITVEEGPLKGLNLWGYLTEAGRLVVESKLRKEGEKVL